MNILMLDPVKLVNKDGCSIHRMELIILLREKMMGVWMKY